MAMVFFKVPFRVGMMGETGYVEKVTFLVETNVPEGDVIYKVENFVFGSGAKYEFPGGIGELELPTSVGANPTSFEYKVTLEIYRSGQKRQVVGPYYMAAPATTDDIPLANWPEVSSVPASWMTTATAQLTAAAQSALAPTVAAKDTAVAAAATATTAASTAASNVAGLIAADRTAVATDRTAVATDRAFVEARVVDDLGTTDGQTKALIETPSSETAQALTATIGSRTSLGPLGYLRSRLTLSRIAPVPLYFCGSSTTAASTASTAEARYPNLVTRALQAAHPSGLTEFTAIGGTAVVTPRVSAGVHGYNGGISGTTSATYLSAQVKTNIAAVKPVAVIHAIGANDWELGRSPETFRTALAAALTEIDTLVGAPVAHILVHQHSRAVTGSAWVWADYLAAMRDIEAARPESVMVIDASATFAGLGVPGADPLGLLHADDVHLVDAGYRVLSEVVAQGIAGASLAPVVPVPTPGWVPPGATVLTSDTFAGVADATDLKDRTTNAALGGTAATLKATTTGNVASGAAAKLAAASYLYFDGAGLGDNVYIGCTLPNLPEGASLDIRASRVGTSGSVNSLTVDSTGRVGQGSAGVVTTQYATAKPGDQVGVSVKGAAMNYYLNGVLIAQRVATLSGGTTSGFSSYAGATNVRIDDVVVASV